MKGHKEMFRGNIFYMLIILRVTMVLQVYTYIIKLNTLNMSRLLCIDSSSIKKEIKLQKATPEANLVIK